MGGNGYLDQLIKLKIAHVQGAFCKEKVGRHMSAQAKDPAPRWENRPDSITLLQSPQEPVPAHGARAAQAESTRVCSCLRSWAGKRGSICSAHSHAILS